MQGLKMQHQIAGVENAGKVTCLKDGNGMFIYLYALIVTIVFMCMSKLPVIGQPLKSVTHGQWNARPMITFPSV